ncbi:metallophosphoesterase [Mycobacterium sp. NPDC003323]
MTDNPAEVVEETARQPRRARVRLRRTAVVMTVLTLLFGVPWWTVVAAGGWPAPVTVVGTLIFAAMLIALPTLLFTGHGKHRDVPSAIGDVLLGVIWVLFVWSVMGNVARLVLLAAGVEDPMRSRIVATAVLAISAGLLVWGYREAMRIPRIRQVEVHLPRLGRGLDGLRVAMITDTHYGPIDRARWSADMVARVNDLDADIVCHVGDIADGTVDVRREQAAPLATVRAATRVYVTGNHEYFSEAQGWMDHMESLAWDALHNRHLIVERGGDRLVVAGVDDDTAAGSGAAGHGQDLTTALAGADPGLPVLLLAHQPKQIRHSVAAGVDLQISGHTHGGQIWPFNFLVRLDQPVVHGLSAHGERTQLYTSRGTGYWGPPFRVFAPSEITLLTLRAG